METVLELDLLTADTDSEINLVKIVCLKGELLVKENV